MMKAHDWAMMICIGAVLTAVWSNNTILDSGVTLLLIFFAYLCFQKYPGKVKKHGN